MARPLGPMTAKMENCIRMEARGEEASDIIREIFGVDPDTLDRKQKLKYTQQMFRWRHRPDAQAVWEDEVKTRVRKCLPKALAKLERQVNDDNGWLSNKAANDFVNLAKSAGIFAAEEKALNVQITGMPELGSPDQDDG